MAFITSPLPPEQQNQFGVPGATSPNPLALLPPQAGGSAGAGTGGTTPDKATPTQFGAPASKLSDYLSANQDQTQAMGGKIAGDLGSQFGQVQGDVTNAGQSAMSQVQAGAPQYDPSLIGEFQKDPTGFAAKPENVSGFQKGFNASYTGPQNFESTQPYANVQNEVQSAVQNADLLKTPSGLSTYLGNTTKGTYTPGMQTLDSSLVSGNAPAYQQITEAAKPFAGLTKYLGDTGAQVNSAIPQAQQDAASTKAQTQAAYHGVADPFVKSLNDTYTAGTKGSIDYNKQLNDIAAKVAEGSFPGLTAEEQALTGFNPALSEVFAQYPLIFPTQAQGNPINFANFFKQGPQAQLPTAENLMTPENIAQYKALSTLSGGQPGGLKFDMPDAFVPMEGQTGAQPGEKPTYNGQQALSAIEQAYGPFYQQALGTGALSQQQIDYMGNLRKLEGGAQPGSQPTTPPPAPGSAGDLGAGFHWDTTSGAWVPTIPLQPPGGDVQTGTTGGGRIAR